MDLDEIDSKPHCVSCGKVICGDLDGIVKLKCSKCRCNNVVAAFKDSDGAVRHVVWQTSYNNENEIYSYIYKGIEKYGVYNQ